MCFATAHSRGLRLNLYARLINLPFLCHSAFARVATRRCRCCIVYWLLCHSAFARVATLSQPKSACRTQTLPQRIRAGCDCIVTAMLPFPVLCLSAFARVATFLELLDYVLFNLCLSAFARVATSCTSPYTAALALCLSAFARVATAEKQCSALRICCEKVDSFSSVGESGLALTIFPFSFAAKATYVAINDSFGRAIDRFFWCEPHRN